MMGLVINILNRQIIPITSMMNMTFSSTYTRRNAKHMIHDTYSAMQAWRELGLIVIVVAITMLMFSTLLFAFESDGPAPEVANFQDITNLCFL